MSDIGVRLDRKLLDQLDIDVWIATIGVWSPVWRSNSWTQWTLYYNYSSPQWQAGKQWWQAWVLPSFPQHAAATTG